MTCPECGMKLPEVETLEYRFCPGCGAQIPVKPERLDETYQTIPPDLKEQQRRQSPGDLEPEKGKKENFTRKIDDRTISPQPISSLKKPELKPPNTPPPDSYFRQRASDAPNSIHLEEKVPPEQVVQKLAPAKNRRIIIVLLIVLAFIILLLGGLFTF